MNTAVVITSRSNVRDAAQQNKYVVATVQNATVMNVIVKSAAKIRRIVYVLIEKR